MSRARLLWLGVPAAGVLELALSFFFSHRAPRVEEWPALREPVAALRQHGELVVVAPEWAEPLARQALGDELMPLRDLARPDESAYARAIEISAMGKESPELAGWKAESERRVGRFTVRVRDNPHPETVAFDFVDQLSPEHVRVEAGTRPCPFRTNAPLSSGGLGGNPTFPARRFACPSGESFFVGVTVIDDDHEYRPRRCIWAHPTPDGPMRIHYRDVPLGAVIRGYGALPWLIFRDGAGAPVELEIRVDGASIGSFVHRDTDGWSGFSFPTGHAGETHDVDFEVRAAEIKDRHFCFQADTR
jgi:hypothetical protein